MYTHTHTEISNLARRHFESKTRPFANDFSSQWRIFAGILRRSRYKVIRFLWNTLVFPFRLYYITVLKMCVFSERRRGQSIALACPLFRTELSIKPINCDVRDSFLDPNAYYESVNIEIYSNVGELWFCNVFFIYIKVI